MKNDLPNDDAAKSYRRNRRLIRIGQAVMAIGALAALSHWIAHITVKGGPPVIQDILVGYPAGGALILIGAVMAGQTVTKKR